VLWYSSRSTVSIAVLMRYSLQPSRRSSSGVRSDLEAKAFLAARWVAGSIGSLCTCN
jgi:hypothetical protein